MSGLRKIAAILVGDVFGYSLLAGADEEPTLARLGAARASSFLSGCLLPSPCRKLSRFH